MEKISIEIHRMTNHIYGYGIISDPVNEKFILDALLNWAQENPTKKIYRHLSRIEQENISDTKFHYFCVGRNLSQEECKEALENDTGGNWEKIRGYPGKDLINTMPYCDRVYYLDIYCQEK